MFRVSVYELSRARGKRRVVRLDDIDEAQAMATMEYNHARNGFGFLAVVAEDKSVGQREGQAA